MATTDPDLVHAVAEELRAFKLRLGPNTVQQIAQGMRDLHLSGGERQQLAEHLTQLVDELAERRRVVAAGPGHHVLVTVDPQRNGGRASFSAGMVPLYAAIGPLNAGDSVEQVREEYALDEAQAAVVAALAEDFRDLAAAGEPAPAEEALRPVYRERAQLVAHLADQYPSVIAFSDPNEPEWPVVYVDTPAGQCSWHLALADLDLFGHVEQVPADDPRAVWDGHSTEEKYRRLAALHVRPPEEQDVCRTEIVSVDGQEQAVRVRGREPMTDLDREVFAELVAAARRRAAEDGHMGIRQELALAWMGAAGLIPNGPEKRRLRAAMKAAKEALTPPKHIETGQEQE